MQERARHFSRPDEFTVSRRSTNPATRIAARADASIAQIDEVLVADRNADLQDVNRLQQRWNRTLGIAESRPGTLDNYNPVLARWNYERLQTDKQRELFRSNELMNITTALRERHKTQESRLDLQIDKEGKIRNEAFPDEPYEAMLERGREYRVQHGSKDLEREKAEIEGFKKIQEVFASPDTPIGSTFIVISPPSEVKGSPYTYKFVDGYQSAEDPQTGERIIKYVRFSSPIETEDYAAIADQLDPEFFERKAKQEEMSGQSIPTDAWYLENPFFVPAQEGQTIDTVFAEHFAADVEAMEEEEWTKLDEIYLPYKLYLLDQLTKEDFDPAAIAKAYNILLLSQEKKHMQLNTEQVIFDAKSTKLQSEAYKYVSRLAQQHGHEQAQEVKAGCGRSGGVALKGVDAIFANSVSQFDPKKQEQEWFTCPKCTYKADGPVGNSCPGCGLTKEAYAEESGISCD